MSSKHSDTKSNKVGTQVPLFDLMISTPQLLKDGALYSNTIELYDAMPKYVWERNADTSGPMVRSFKHKGADYTLSITPASLQLPDGSYAKKFPGLTEELIEDILRKIAADGMSNATDKGELGVSFSLYELRKQLASIGCTRSLVEIKQSLQVMAQTVTLLTGRRDKKKLQITSTLISGLTLVSKDTEALEDAQMRCQLTFHPLVTRSVKDGTLRLINYDTCMKYKTSLGRQLHKRMSHNFVQAKVDTPYTITMSRLLDDCGVQPLEKPSKTLKRKVEPALEEMISLGALRKYVVSRENSDITLELYPTDSFVQEIKNANFWARYRKERAVLEAESASPAK